MYRRSMPKKRLHHPFVPASLNGWLLVNENGQPRFWATVWADVIKTGVDHGTRGGLLGAVEKLYRFATEQNDGKDRLDAIIASGDFDAIETVLGGFLVNLRNESACDAVDRERTWQTAVLFIHDVMDHLGRTTSAEMTRVQANLLRLQHLYGQIAPRPPKPPMPIRALPAVVVEDIYEQFNPMSERNPFRTETLRWRNYLIFLLMLHLGLRRGEVLILPADAIKEDFDPETGEDRHWINVVETLDEDPRSVAPSLKNAFSQRQLPIPKDLVTLADRYILNYRGQPGHAYLVNSQKGKPLALSSLAEVFAIITANLSERAKKALTDRGKSSVSPHDLRHTAAVGRLARYIKNGNDLETAIEKMRVFFGWSMMSQMPRHYARAYFATSTDDICAENFDIFVAALRDATGEQK
ncbi:site-specific integrase [Azospirillum sp. TSO5]|uniref:site-specific integrase n=1 Tax=Azospirillum sp. TSO5 TaxID=716760 RepID=UPI000D65E2A4|nr:site-specific integrase [Azospirillum sp. TSO5]